MHPEGIFVPHWYMVGALLTKANEDPFSPGVGLADFFKELAGSDLFSNGHHFAVDLYHDALRQCVNWGLISASYNGDSIDQVSISPLGVYMATHDREMRVGRKRPQGLTLPSRADNTIFAIQMGYEEIRKMQPMNAYRNLISAYSLAVPAEQIFRRLDEAVEAIRTSNSISAEIRDEVLAKIEEGKRCWKAGPIAIALLGALILNPLLEAWNAVAEEVLKPQIEATAKFIREITGI